jgi:hypothetical protein
MSGSQPIAEAAVPGPTCRTARVGVEADLALLGRLEFWPLTPEMQARPAVIRLLRRLTFLWAGVNFAIGATTLVLVKLLPLAAFVASKQLVAWSITGLAIAVTIDCAVRTARREGFVAEGPPAGLLDVPARVTARAGRSTWIAGLPTMGAGVPGKLQRGIDHRHDRAADVSNLPGRPRHGRADPRPTTICAGVLVWRPGPPSRADPGPTTANAHRSRASSSRGRTGFCCAPRGPTAA